MNNKPTYNIVLGEIRFDKRVEPMARLLYGEICALCNYDPNSGEFRPCFASNKHFAELYSVEERSIVRWINSLEALGYIKRAFNNVESRRYLEPNIEGVTKMSDGVTKMSEGGGQKCHLGGDKNVTHTYKSLPIRDYHYSSKKNKKNFNNTQSPPSYDMEKYKREALENEIVYERKNKENGADEG